MGKEVLLCNSPYIGGKDYFGDRAHYFEPNYESLRDKIGLMWDQRRTFPSRTLADKKAWVQENHSLQTIAKNILGRLQAVCKS